MAAFRLACLALHCTRSSLSDLSIVSTLRLQLRPGVPFRRCDWSDHCEGGSVALPIHVNELKPPATPLTMPFQVSEVKTRVRGPFTVK